MIFFSFSILGHFILPGKTAAFSKVRTLFFAIYNKRPDIDEAKISFVSVQVMSSVTLNCSSSPAYLSGFYNFTDCYIKK